MMLFRFSYGADSVSYQVKSALSGLRKFLPTESPFKMIKNVFYFTLKTFFVLKIFFFTFWSCIKTV